MHHTYAEPPNLLTYRHLPPTPTTDTYHRHLPPTPTNPTDDCLLTNVSFIFFFELVVMASNAAAIPCIIADYVFRRRSGRTLRSRIHHRRSHRMPQLQTRLTETTSSV